MTNDPTRSVRLRQAEKHLKFFRACKKRDAKQGGEQQEYWGNMIAHKLVEIFKLKLAR